MLSGSTGLHILEMAEVLALDSLQGVHTFPTTIGHMSAAAYSDLHTSSVTE